MNNIFDHSRPIRVAISYRVLQAWRVPVFDRLSALHDIELLVLYGEDFEGSKVVSYTGAVPAYAIKLPTNKISFSTKNGTVYLPYHKTLWKKLRTFAPDIVITEGASNAINNLICYAYARRHRKKIVQWGLGHLKDRKMSFSRRILNMLFFSYIERNSDAAIAYSSEGGSYYRKIGLADHNVYVAVNTVDTIKRTEMSKKYADSVSDSWPPPVPKIFSILFVGALTENKNIDLLLRVFSKFNRRIKQSKLVIVGSGKLLEELKQLAEELNIAQQVEFPGHVSVNIAQYFHDATVFVMPGLGGLAVSDSLCHSVPVICGIGDGSEVDLIDGTNGKILRPLNENTLLIELLDLEKDVSKQKSWRENASRVIDESFNIENYVQIIRCCIQEQYKC